MAAPNRAPLASRWSCSQPPPVEFPAVRIEAPSTNARTPRGPTLGVRGVLDCATTCVDNHPRPQPACKVNNPGGKDSFYDLSARLTDEYDHAQARNAELCAENSRLRSDLAHMSSTIVRLREGTLSPRVASLGGQDDLYHKSCPDSMPFGQWTKRSADNSLSHRKMNGLDAMRLDVWAIVDNKQSCRDGPPESARAKLQHLENGGIVTGSLLKCEDSHFPMIRDSGQQTPPPIFDFDEEDLFEEHSRHDNRHKTKCSIHSLDSQMSRLELLDLWDEQLSSPQHKSRRSSAASASHSVASSQWNEVTRSGYVGSLRTGDKLRENNLFQRFVMPPSHPVAICWDMVTTLMILYDLIMIPMDAFSLSSRWLLVMDWVIAATWSMDFMVNFVRGVEIEGIVELRPSRLAKRYAKGWLGLDLFTCTVDWVVLVSSGDGAMEVLKNLRMRRLIRFLRVIRLIRLLKVVNRDMIKELMGSQPDHAMVLLTIFKLLVLIWVITHYMACGWYAIGNSQDDGWLSVYFTDDMSKGFRYITSFHWALTQFTPAGMEVVPVNTLERTYNVLVIMFGLVMFSCFVSNMTNSIRYYQEQHMDQNKQAHMLRNYLSQHRVSLALMNSISSFTKYRLQMKDKTIQERDVLALRSLPENLLSRLHEEVYAAVLDVHPLFLKLREVEEPSFASLCHLALTEKAMSLGEELFRCGMRCASMYFVTSGPVSYFLGYDELIPTEIATGKWLCEACLWCRWEHRGRLTAANSKALLVFLEAAEFQTILSRTKSLPQVQKYAAAFASKVASDVGGASYMTDMSSNAEICNAMVNNAFGDSGKIQAAACKIVMLWDIEENKWTHAFTAWKAYVQKQKENKKRNPWRRLSAMFRRR